MKKYKNIASLIIILILVFSTNNITFAIDEKTYLQPKEGTGSNVYLYDECQKITYSTLRGYSFVFVPANSVDEELPVISFLHGWEVGDMINNYIGLIEHIVKKGYIVIYPNYQYALTPTNMYAAYASNQIIDGFEYLESNYDELPVPAKNHDGSYMFGMIGFSAGGVTSINLASAYEDYNLPKPQFIMTMEAHNGNGIIPTFDASTVPVDTNLLMVVASDDSDFAYKTSATFWNQMGHIPIERKQWICISSDSGDVELTADHLWPHTASYSTDTLDYYGSYKWAVAIANDTFFSTDRDYWYSSDKQIYMGTWSDGTPVRPAVNSSVNAVWTDNDEQAALNTKPSIIMTNLLLPLVNYLGNIFLKLFGLI